MAYRVYDTEKHVWLKDNIYMNPDGDLFKIKQSLFGMIRIPLELSQDRYIYHEYINLLDKYGKAIFEGDYIEASVANKTSENDSNEHRTVIGVVVFAEEISSYIILCEESNEFFTLGNEVTEFIKVIGNVFDGYEKSDENGQQTL